MHPILDDLMKQEEAKLKYYESSTYDYSEEIQEQQTRISEMNRLWKAHSKKKYVQRMTSIVEKKVEKYHADFFYWDLAILDDYEGRFAWFVGDNGTHIVLLDNPNEELQEKQKIVLNSIVWHYKDYKLYVGNPMDDTLKKGNINNLEFRIVQPVG